ncbi:VOC family protein [Kineococcus sp. R86509]|uniref:VOC family protein n=1 Tax=Kineococcus sp. R86509 TaxID=3093851 RepID=UPI0036D2B9A0
MNTSTTQSGRPRLSAVVLDSPEPPELATFYRHLLGMEPEQWSPDWIVLRDPDGGVGISFQREAAYVPPRWPQSPGEQQVQDHLDIAVDDLAAGVAHAVAAGAELFEFQPQDTVRVMRDPHGHVFCLYLPE